MGSLAGWWSRPTAPGYLVLDGFGGVHKFGTARSGTIGSGNSGYFGWDIAAPITITPNGRGYTVLDGFGGLHSTSAAPRVRPRVLARVGHRPLVPLLTVGQRRVHARRLRWHARGW